MAGHSQSTQRRNKGARKVARRAPGPHAAIEGASSGGQASPGDAPSITSTTSPEPPGPEERQAGTALALVPQALPIPVTQPFATAHAPKGRPGGKGRIAALGGAVVAAIAFAFVSIQGEIPREQHPTVTQAAAPTGNAEAVPAPTASATTAKQKTRDARNSVAATKTATSQAKVPAKTGSAPVTARSDKSASPVKSKAQPTQSARAQKKSDPSPLIAPALHQDAAAMVSKAPVGQNRYAQCLELPNFLRREQCKWQVCSGKWGQDGCPSYERNIGEVNS